MVARDEINEAELEARIAATIKRALPFFPAGQIKHQLTFSVTLGHKAIKVDGAKASRASGRCDVLLVMDGKPLAILELKAPGIALTDDDRRQGLSYARLTEPWTPLVIVANGEETKYYETFTGEPWEPDKMSEEELAKLFDSAAKIAQGDLRNAIDTLIGPQSSVWVALVRSMTESAMADLTGDVGNPLLPFAEGLYIPTKEPGLLFGLLTSGERCVIVTGVPLSGKSNVLRGFLFGLEDRDDMAALFIDAGSTGQGILQSLANEFTKEFGWGVSKDDVRAWLIRMSTSEAGPVLVLVIDAAAAEVIRPEIDELLSGAFGANLKLALAVDESAIDSLIKNPKKTQLSRIGTLAKIIKVGPLDDEEFELALKTLYYKRIEFMKGAHRAPEYRQRWILRWIVADALKAYEYKDEDSAAVMPSMMGLSLIWEAAERFSSNPELVGRFTTLAEAVLEDIDTPGRSIAFSLTLISSFIARAQTARAHLGDSDYKELLDQGYLKFALLDQNEQVVVAQIPELLMTTLPVVLGRMLQKELREDPENAASKFVARCGRLMTGDVIGAQAIVEAARHDKGLPLELLENMLAEQPRQNKPKPGSRMKCVVAGGVALEMLVLEDGRIRVTGPDGTEEIIENEDDDLLLHADYTSWQILSHIAALPFAVRDKKDGSILGRLDPQILVEVGSYNHPIRPVPPSGVDNAFQHHMPSGGTIVCQDEGIIEPITYALMRAMADDREQAEYVIDQAVERKSLPLAARLHIALTQVSHLKDEERAAWAKEMLNTRIRSVLTDSDLMD